ncbi:MAG: hypothetical protein LBE20_02710 [Deltaproteobacteria bacterium]|jgi:hypothetical protein|nr:hypothetical protein [Deltaproteobacteria bacterium]
MQQKTIDFHIQQKMKALAEALKDDHVFVHFDSRRAGVNLPAHLLGIPMVTLKLSLRFNGAINYDTEGIVASLKFGTEYYECIVPWVAVWGITLASGEKKLWREDIPQEILETILEADKKPAAIVKQEKNLKNKSANSIANLSKTEQLSPADKRKQLKLIS